MPNTTAKYINKAQIVSRVKTFIANVSMSLRAFPDQLIYEKHDLLDGKSSQENIEHSINELYIACSQLESSVRIKADDLKNLEKIFFDKRNAIKEAYEFLLFSLISDLKCLEDLAKIIKDDISNGSTVSSVDTPRNSMRGLLEGGIARAIYKIERILNKIENCVETTYSASSQDTFMILSQFECFIDSIVSNKAQIDNYLKTNDDVFDNAIKSQYQNAFKLCMDCAWHDVNTVNTCFSLIFDRIDKFYHFQKNTYSARLNLLNQTTRLPDGSFFNNKKMTADNIAFENGLANIKSRLEGTMFFKGMQQDINIVAAKARLLKAKFPPVPVFLNDNKKRVIVQHDPLDEDAVLKKIKYI
ncbi:MAG: hypothetical protein H2069_02320 [Legionella sp.]|nr:hypothetical protein [Legionella sp.]